MVSIACSATVFSVISGRDVPVASRQVRMCRPVGAPGWHECKAHVGRWPWPGGSTETRWPPFPDAPRPGPWRCRGPVARLPYRAIAADGMGKNSTSCAFFACILPPPACRRRWRWQAVAPRRRPCRHRWLWWQNPRKDNKTSVFCPFHRQRAAPCRGGAGLVSRLFET